MRKDFTRKLDNTDKSELTNEKLVQPESCPMRAGGVAAAGCVAAVQIFVQVVL